MQVVIPSAGLRVMKLSSPRQSLLTARMNWPPGCFIAIRAIAAGRLCPCAQRATISGVAAFVVDKLGGWRFTLLGWVDHFTSWAGELRKRIAAQKDPEIPAGHWVQSQDRNAGFNVGSSSGAQDVALALRTGAGLIEAAAVRARANDAKRLREIARGFEKLADENRSNYEDPCDEELLELMRRYPDLTNATRYEMELPVWADRERARFSSWYELFPRSASPIPGQHGTFRDVEKAVARDCGHGI